MVTSQAKRIAVLLGAFGRRGPAKPCSSDVSPAAEGPLLAPESHAFIEQTGTGAAAAARDKADWLAAQGSVTIGHVAPYYRSEGFLICLEGLRDASGSPVLYSHGMPHGSEDAVLQQVRYAHERVIAQCIALGRELRCTSIVNVRSPTFRFPDAPLRAAIDATRRYYPWAAHSPTVFVGFPAAIRRMFGAARPLMSRRHYEAISFADDWNDLADIVPSMAGVKRPVFDVGAYIRSRREAEGAADDECASARYRGGRLDFRLFDRLSTCADPPLALAGQSDADDDADYC